MEDIKYYDKNIAISIDRSLWELTGATLQADNSIIINSGGSIKVTFGADKSLSSSCKYLKQTVQFEMFAEYNRYEPSCYSTLKLVYDGENSAIDSNLVVLNKGNKILGNLWANEAIIDLQAKSIVSIEMSIMNNSAESLTIKDIFLYYSQDIQPYQIATVLKEEVISADVIQATANFSGAMFTQYLRTNVFSMDAIKSLGGGVVNYLTAEDNELGFYTSTLSDVEKEQFKISVNMGSGQKEDIYFWYAIIGESEDAYKYITTIDPRDKYPDISDEHRDSFRFMVWKTTSSGKKMSIEFIEKDDGSGNKVTVPMIIMGAGVDADPNSARGKGFIYKDANSMNVKYIDSSGKEKGMIADDTGTYLINVMIKLEYAKRYNNGIEAKFQGDPTSYKLRFSTDSNDDFNGIWINNTDFVSSPYINDYLPEEN